MLSGYNFHEDLLVEINDEIISKTFSPRALLVEEVSSYSLLPLDFLRLDSEGACNEMEEEEEEEEDAFLP